MQQFSQSWWYQNWWMGDAKKHPAVAFNNFKNALNVHYLILGVCPTSLLMARDLLKLGYTVALVDERSWYTNSAGHVIGAVDTALVRDQFESSIEGKTHPTALQDVITYQQAIETSIARAESIANGWRTVAISDDAQEGSFTEQQSVFYVNPLEWMFALAKPLEEQGVLWKIDANFYVEGASGGYTLFCSSGRIDCKELVCVNYPLYKHEEFGPLRPDAPLKNKIRSTLPQARHWAQPVQLMESRGELTKPTDAQTTTRTMRSEPSLWLDDSSWDIITPKKWLKEEFFTRKNSLKVQASKINGKLQNWVGGQESVQRGLKKWADYKWGQTVQSVHLHYIGVKEGFILEMQGPKDVKKANILSKNYIESMLSKNPLRTPVTASIWETPAPFAPGFVYQTPKPHLHMIQVCPQRLAFSALASVLWLNWIEKQSQELLWWSNYVVKEAVSSTGSDYA